MSVRNTRTGHEIAKKAAIGAGLLVFGGGVAIGAMVTFEKAEMYVDQNMSQLEHPVAHATVMSPRPHTQELSSSVGPSIGDYAVPLAIVAAEIAGAAEVYRRFSGNRQLKESTETTGVAPMTDTYKLKPEEARAFEEIARAYDER